MPCSSCNRDIRLKAKGLCGACYKRLRTRGTTGYYESRRVGPCTACRRDIEIVARGLCRACYQRQLKRGTTDYAPKRVRGVCSIAGCGKPHAARGLCDLHHQRLLNTGDPEKTKRPDDWGAKEGHPLYGRWQWLMRHKAQHPVDPAWTDFLTFVADIGEAPPAPAKLFAADEAKPIGPANFLWKRSYTERVDGEDAATFNRRRQRAYRAVQPERAQDYDLKRLYGLSRDEVAGIRRQQNGVCAICHTCPPGKGRDGGLCVDHCHSSGKVRGLLCHACNRAIGLLKDDPAILRSAIAYLQQETTR